MYRFHKFRREDFSITSIKFAYFQLYLYNNFCYRFFLIHASYGMLYLIIAIIEIYQWKCLYFQFVIHSSSNSL